MIRVCFIITLGLSLFGCGQEDAGPTIPEALAAKTESPSADAGKPNGSEAAPPTATDARLAILPEFLKEQVTGCERNQHFYDLGSQTCTDALLATFPCTVDQALRDMLDPTTLTPLDTYLATKAADLTLYSCTVDSINISLHFYKFVDGVVQYRKLNVAKKP